VIPAARGWQWSTTATSTPAITLSSRATTRGNILTTPLRDLAASEKQQRFGRDKKDTLPRICRECEFLFVCNGECPKNRFMLTPDGEPGWNYLCAGYKAFFHHADGVMKIMADLIRRGQTADGIMKILSGGVPPPATAKNS
jgi:uncharacterized protein